jgi:hypothetical protein
MAGFSVADVYYGLAHDDQIGAAPRRALPRG